MAELEHQLAALKAKTAASNSASPVEELAKALEALKHAPQPTPTPAKDKADQAAAEAKKKADEAAEAKKKADKAAEEAKKEADEKAADAKKKADDAKKAADAA